VLLDNPGDVHGATVVRDQARLVYLAKQLHELAVQLDAEQLPPRAQLVQQGPGRAAGAGAKLDDGVAAADVRQLEDAALEKPRARYDGSDGLRPPQEPLKERKGGVPVRAAEPG
jgi:hypothetical protein